MNTSMNFTVFTASVVKGLQEKMGENYKISSNHVKKNNGVELTGIVVEEKGCNASPAIYIDDFYENYRNGISFNEIIEALYKIFHRARFKEAVDLSNFSSYEKAKKQIAFKVINYEKNWEMLKEIPHKVFCNLALVFYYDVQEPPFYGKASILIRKTHLENWNIDSEELYQGAMENTPALFPAQIENIEDVMFEMLDSGMKKDYREQSREKDFSAEIDGEKWIEDLFTKFQEEMKKDIDRIPMYVLSNKQKYQGAACMFYPDVLKNFAKKLNCDLYILPSSIHEVILLPVTEDNSKEKLLDMVTEINRTQVEDCEVLADSVFCYKKDSDNIERIC